MSISMKVIVFAVFLGECKSNFIKNSGQIHYRPLNISRQYHKHTEIYVLPRIVYSLILLEIPNVAKIGEILSTAESSPVLHQV